MHNNVINIEKQNADYLHKMAILDLALWKITSDEYIDTVNKIRLKINQLLNECTNTNMASKTLR